MNIKQEETQIGPTSTSLPIEKVEIENAKEMTQEAKDLIEGLTKGRELVDQKITYFLGLLVAILSSCFLYGFKPFMQMVVAKSYALAFFFLGFFISLCLLFLWLMNALLPREVYIKGIDPLNFWEEKWLIMPHKKMLILQSERYQYMCDFMRALIVWKGRVLKITVFLFTLLLLVSFCCVLFIPSLAEKVLGFLKA